MKHATTKKLSTPSATAGRGSTPTRTAQALLDRLLPDGWESYFTMRRAGKWWGLSIQCPTCEVRPPKELLGAQRWRWLAAHMAAHRPKLVK